MVVGQENFFVTNFWWSFRVVERGTLLAETVEKLKKIGVVSYFLNLQLLQVKKKEAATAHKQFEQARMPVSQSVIAGSGATLMDGLISESLVLLLYGISAAIMAFIGVVMKNYAVHFASLLAYKFLRLCLEVKPLRLESSARKNAGISKMFNIYNGMNLC